MGEGKEKKGEYAKGKLPDRINEQTVTYDVYASLPEDGNRYEVVDGKLECMAGPRVDHQSVVVTLVHFFKTACTNDYYIYVAPLDVILSEVDVRQPDLTMVHRSRGHIITKRGIEGAPDLVVEAMSPGSRKRDKVDKILTYAKYGVAEYWIIDPVSRTLEQYTLQDNSYKLNNFFEGDEIVGSNRFPCIGFKLSELFLDIPDSLLQ